MALPLYSYFIHGRNDENEKNVLAETSCNNEILSISIVRRGEIIQSKPPRSTEIKMFALMVTPYI